MDIRITYAVKIQFHYQTARGAKFSRRHSFEGILPNLERRYRETESGMVREELGKLLDIHDVRVLDPESGSEFDPALHHAVMREHTDRQLPNTIMAVLQTGYALDDYILRPATVTVAAPPEDA